ncbi:outer membrane protein assembly factor BamD [Thiohalobacter sp. IOR34]|uniref:outer membrane protein assembly factor BamD n=1 Tax=Thiohalobacter sp. IOR34 TaxID=3057176 RepID=UPI0025B1A08B|nr:outer membrane protein assembly factor BamD [Thiohalobacter sp. IOR34]WJW74924.1 outer membrane protein assembly factor BamD [Thiohalobacter sp. IOR34]
MPLLRLFLLGLLTLNLLAGCSLLPDEIDETKGWSAQKLYAKAKENLSEGNYERAIELYEKLEARYPFGRYAQQALLESAYAYYKYDEPDTAIATLDRFIKTYPQHPHLDYAYYLKGLVNFNRGRNLIDRFLPRDPSERDPGAARQSFFDFQTLVKRFPASPYSKDATQRMLFLRNNLASYEVHVADYYMRRHAYVAAINRAEYVIEHFPRTPAVPDALEILIRAYRILDLNDLAEDALRVYRLNYP